MAMVVMAHRYKNGYGGNGPSGPYGGGPYDVGPNGEPYPPPLYNGYAPPPSGYSGPNGPYSPGGPYGPPPPYVPGPYAPLPYSSYEDPDSRRLRDLDYQKADAKRRLDLINSEQSDILDRQKRLDQERIDRINRQLKSRSSSESNEISGLEKRLADLDKDKKDTLDKLDKIESERQIILQKLREKKQDEIDRLNRELAINSTNPDIFTV
ncbi:hypothetical protein DdX_12775 [Ditylenchus destructor]|uniref:Uncharacterized protein n=1 Tax=Ditylenchus destructor TaxID=166010 RepID=A0AAD4MUJ4_9BILA|nr:hypothetical protein DdX_12775 [Ditylenchus destructor]